MSTIEQVQVAVQSLHLPTVDADTRQQALRYLERLQNSVRIAPPHLSP